MNAEQQVKARWATSILNKRALRPLIQGLFLSFSLTTLQPAFAASCCGGGAGSGVILPKFNDAMWDLSVAHEAYEGYWTKDGDHQDDPANSDLLQQRLQFSYAHRIGEQWQLNASLPVVDNQNTYGGNTSQVTAIGDTHISLWYEAFERVTCVYKITGWESLKPSIYIGTGLTLPTGVSAYSDRVDNSFDITGLGFYRLDANAIIEKTVYPWSVSWQGSYGYHFERPINQEYGQAVTPYDKQLGERHSSSLALAYTWFLPGLAMLNLGVSHQYLKQGATYYDGQRDDLSGFSKTSLGSTLSYTTSPRDWIVKLGLTQAQSGYNYPKTLSVTMGVSHVFNL